MPPLAELLRINVLPEHTAVLLPMVLIAGNGLTVNETVLVATPQRPPAVVSVSVTGSIDEGDEVYVAVFGVLPPLLVNMPPAPPSSQVADVAPPPNEPPKAAVVPLRHIGETEETVAIGFGLTVNDTVGVSIPQEPPDVVSFKVTGVADESEAVYVAVPGVVPVLLLNEPPAPPSDQIADVAPPP